MGTNFNDIYGKKIDLVEANSLIKEFQVLDAITTKVIKSDAPDELKIKAVEMNSKSYNAFIFTKDLIQRFFDNSEKDQNGNPVSADYLMVLLGAHPNEVGDFKKGSFTVLTVGCIKKEEPNSKSPLGDIFFPLGIPQPANEYPPKAVVKVLHNNDDKENGNPYFVTIQ